MCELIYLWFVVCHFGVDWSEHATASATWNTKIDANICFQSHSTTLQRCVDGQMDWITAFACIILMDDRTVIGDFMTSSPPA